jgi:branched-subunit amino acid transport protein
MTFGDRVVGTMKLDANTFEDIERDPTAMGQAVGVIVLAAVSFGIGNIFYGGMTGIVFGIISSIVGYAFWAIVVWLVGTKLMPDPATKADLPEAFRVIAFAAAPGVLGAITIIPLLGYALQFLLWIWSIAAMVVAVKAVLDYTDTFKAVIVVLIGFCVFWVIRITLAMMFFGAWR